MRQEAGGLTRGKHVVAVACVRKDAGPRPAAFLRTGSLVATGAPVIECALAVCSAIHMPFCDSRSGRNKPPPFALC